MTDAMSIWVLFKDSTVLQAVLGALIGFVVMQVFQHGKKKTLPPMDERLLNSGHRGGSNVPLPGDLPFRPPPTAQSKQQQRPKPSKVDINGLEDSEDEEEEEAGAKQTATQKQQKQKTKKSSPAKESVKASARERRRPVIKDGSGSELDGDSEDEEESDVDAGDEHGDSDEDQGMVAYANVAYPEQEMLSRSAEFLKLMQQRRSCRHFSTRSVDPELLRRLVLTAGTSPSGAHTEPWTYVCVTDQLVKRRIREIVEEEEEINYARRMGAEWKADLARIRTTWEKPYLTDAPVIVIIMRQVHGYRRNQERKRHYYSEISISISAGLFLAAVQNVGLCTLTSTPMNAGPALRRLLGRPPNEKVHLLLPLGYAAEDAEVPNLTRKSLDRLMVCM